MNLKIVFPPSKSSNVQKSQGETSLIMKLKVNQRRRNEKFLGEPTAISNRQMLANKLNVFLQIVSAAEIQFIWQKIETVLILAAKLHISMTSLLTKAM